MFFLLKESELTPSGANLLDGRYSVFGYVTEGQDALGYMKVRRCTSAAAGCWRNCWRWLRVARAASWGGHHSRRAAGGALRRWRRPWLQGRCRGVPCRPSLLAGTLLLLLLLLVLSPCISPLVAQVGDKIEYIKVVDGLENLKNGFQG
jgi:cyclophilin family peptidyl-prolyl cis-trans isomerase